MRRLALLALVLATGCGRSFMWMGDAPDASLLDASLADAAPADAARRDAGPPGPVTCARELTIEFTPTERAQLAVWVRDEDGAFATLALTAATSVYGIGNRPGALQLNSGFRWPYGRRENVLPGWAGARLGSGAPGFPRVIFRIRPEGHASRSGTSEDAYRDTRDDYFCLPFQRELTTRDNLDAVTCASPLNSDKGRYLGADDLAAGYAEPEERLGVGGARALDATSAYPPRRDLSPAADSGDHPDVARYASDALAAMPELDAVTMATPRSGERVRVMWTVPEGWRDQVVVSVEAHTEGDYTEGYDPATHPTPTQPPGAWDLWGQNYGYPYRGQPSVIFDLDVDLPPTDRAVDARDVNATRPTRRGTLDASLETVPMDATMLDDPLVHPGSGADRLLGVEGARVTVTARQRCRARE